MPDNSAGDAKQRLAGLEERERTRGMIVAEFQCFCDRVAAEAQARGLTKSALNKLLQE